MKNLYGVWIDHKHAFVVKANLIGEMEVVEIKSQVEAHNHGGLNGDEHLIKTDQRANAEHIKNEMHNFTKEIISYLTDASELVIFGPSTAKNDLKHEVEKHKALLNSLKGLEPTDKLSITEIKEFVKSYFNLPRK